MYEQWLSIEHTFNTSFLALLIYIYLYNIFCNFHTINLEWFFFSLFCMQLMWICENIFTSYAIPYLRQNKKQIVLETKQIITILPKCYNCMPLLKVQLMCTY